MIEKEDKNYIEKKVDLTLKRIQSNYIDILYIHWPKDSDSIKKTVESLEILRKRDKIRYIGISNFSVSDTKAALSEGNIDFLQTGYSFIYREGEKEIIPYCISKGISIIAYSFYAQGILTSKDLSEIGIKTNDRRKQLIFFEKGNIDIVKKTLFQLKAISDKTEYSIPALLINWAKSKPWLVSILTGAKNRNQIEETLKGENLKIEKPIIEELEQISLKTDISRQKYKNIFNHTYGVKD